MEKPTIKKLWKDAYKAKGMGFARLQFETTKYIRDEIHKMAAEKQLTMCAYMRMKCNQWIKEEKDSKDVNS